MLASVAKEGVVLYATIYVLVPTNFLAFLFLLHVILGLVLDRIKMHWDFY